MPILDPSPVAGAPCCQKSRKRCTLMQSMLIVHMPSFLHPIPTRKTSNKIIDTELSRPETPPFSCIFTREGYIEYTGCGNTEHRGLKARAPPDCHLGQTSLRKGATEHILLCDESIKGLATYPRFEQKCLAASYSTVKCSSICIHTM